jgi:hypothetical protein
LGEKGKEKNRKRKLMSRSEFEQTNRNIPAEATALQVNKDAEVFVYILPQSVVKTSRKIKGL